MKINLHIILYVLYIFENIVKLENTLIVRHILDVEKIK